MNGIHDMGGMHGFGPIELEAKEPVFHEPWEARMFGVRREMLAGLTTFAALSYVLAVNPAIMSAAGMDRLAQDYAGLQNAVRFASKVAAGFLLGWLVQLAVAAFAYQLTRARLMVQQYPWLYRRKGLLGWEERH